LYEKNENNFSNINNIDTMLSATIHNQSIPKSFSATTTPKTNGNSWDGYWLKSGLPAGALASFILLMGIERWRSIPLQLPKYLDMKLLVG
jgi:hypothetical protein